MGGRAQLVVPWNTTYKGNIDPFAKDDTTIIISLLSFIPRTCMCLAPFPMFDPL